MSSIFPDVNVLLALFVRGHAHQPMARRWYQEADSPALVLCRVSQIGFLRLLTTPSMMQGDVLTDQQAWALFEQLLADQVLEISPEPAGIETLFREFSAVHSASPKRWSDAYFGAFAMLSGLRLATFDVALAQRTPRSVLLRG